MAPNPLRKRSALLALTAVLALLALTPSVAGAQQAPLQFGAFSPGDPFAGNTNNTDALQAALGRRIDIVNWYQNWGGGDWISAVQNHVVNAVADSGRAPMITWEPWDPAAGTNQPRFSLSKIAGGDFDAYITTWAVALKALGRTVNLRPMHEMNGNWYPWGGSVNGNSPALYVQAWRRMHDIFARLGVANVRWVWSPNNVDVGGHRMEDFYPGAGYVDILAVDGYNWGSTSPGNVGWQSFSEVFSSAYNRLSQLGSQPIWIAEVGSAPEGGDKAAWIRDMFAKAKDMPRLQAIVWFNENKEKDWRADASADTAAAFRPGNEQHSPESASDRTSGSTTSAKARLKLVARSRARTGRKATLRWKATRAASVKTWHTYLDGKRVRIIKSSKAPVLRKRIARTGKHRWTVVGRDAAGKRVVSASKNFRAVRR